MREPQAFRAKFVGPKLTFFAAVADPQNRQRMCSGKAQFPETRRAAGKSCTSKRELVRREAERQEDVHQRERPAWAPPASRDENDVPAVVERESEVDEELAEVREDEQSRAAQGGVEPTQAEKLKVGGAGSRSWMLEPNDATTRAHQRTYMHPLVSIVHANIVRWGTSLNVPSRHATCRARINMHT